MTELGSCEYLCVSMYIHIFTYPHTCVRMCLRRYVGMIVFYSAFVSSQICSSVHSVDINVFLLVQIMLK